MDTPVEVLHGTLAVGPAVAGSSFVGLAGCRRSLHGGLGSTAGNHRAAAAAVVAADNIAAVGDDTSE